MAGKGRLRRPFGRGWWRRPRGGTRPGAGLCGPGSHRGWGRLDRRRGRRRGRGGGGLRWLRCGWRGGLGRPGHGRGRGRWRGWRWRRWRRGRGGRRLRRLGSARRCRGRRCGSRPGGGRRGTRRAPPRRGGLGLDQGASRLRRGQLHDEGRAGRRRGLGRLPRKPGHDPEPHHHVEEDRCEDQPAEGGAA